MKRFYRLCAFLLVLLLLAGCSGGPANDNDMRTEAPDNTGSGLDTVPDDAEPENTEPAKQAGFVPLPDSAFPGEYPMVMDVSGDLLLFVTGDDNMQTIVRLWDLTTNALVAQEVLQNTDDDFINGAAFVDGEVVLYNEWGKKQYRYDTGLRLLSESPYQYQDPTVEILEKYDRLDEGFVMFDDYASRCLDLRNEALMFYDNMDVVYFQQQDDDSWQMASCGQRVAWFEERDGTFYFDIRDYEALQIIGSASLKAAEPGEECAYPYACGFNEKYVCIPLTGEVAGVDAIYIWDYTVEPTYSALPAQAMAYDEIEDAAEKLVEQIETEFPILIEFNPLEDDFLIYDYELVEETNPLERYLALRMLQQTLRLYPEGLFADICDEMFDSYQITIVERIMSDEADAYASNQDGRVYIVLATWGFTRDNIVHEIMHTMDYMLGDIDEAWFDLNPEGFSYDDYDTERQLPYEQADFAFARPYGMKSQLEDRAVTMETLFQAALNEEAPECLSYEIIRRKAELLCDRLREAYPSVRNAGDVIWERFLSE